MTESELPSYIMESIVADVLSEIRLSAKNELMSELERENNVDMAKGIQQEKLAE